MYLRPARQDDLSFFFALRTERAVRAQSRQGGGITLASHQRWFQAALADQAHRRLYVAESSQAGFAGLRFGTARLDRHGRGGEVSLALRPELRGHGLADPVLLGLLTRLRRLGWGRTATAMVRAGNVPSVLAFTRAGFLVQGIERTSRGPWLVMERRRKVLGVEPEEGLAPRARQPLDGGNPR